MLKKTRNRISSDQVSFRRDLITTAALPLLALALFLVISLWELSSLLSATQWVDHTDQVITQARTTQELMLDMETGLRGYLLTQSPVFLEPYQNAAPTIGNQFASLEQLVSDNPAQTQQVQRVRSQFGEWEQFAQQALASKSPPTVNDQLHGKQLMDQVRQQINAFIDVESGLRISRLQTAQQTAQVVLATSIGIALLLAIFLVIYTRGRFRYLDRQFEDMFQNARQQTEEASTQREWLQGTLASIGDGVIATDTTGTVTFINRVAQSLTEATLQETRGTPLSTVFNVVDERTREPIVIPAMVDTLAALNAAPTAQEVSQVVLIGKHGRETQIENSVAPIRDAKGRTLGTVWVFRDLTERKQTSAKLSASERRYRDLTNAMPLLLWTATPAGEIDYSNRQWYDYTGLTPAQSKSAVEWQPVLHPDDLETVIAHWNQALKTGQAYEIEYRLKRAADGAYVWHLGRSVPICAEDDDHILAWVGTLTDIDKQKQNEVILLERTAELELSTQRLEDRNHELDQFAYVTSHDLKAPLRGIANLSQWIEEDLGQNVSEEVHHQMELLRGRVHRMEGLIDGILQYSRVGRVKGTIEKVNVDALLKEIADLLAPPPEITVTVEPGMPEFRTERLMLQQVFSNLIGNAIKHRPTPKGHVTVGVQDRPAFYEFTVADDGPGIPAEFHQKIFVIFQTLESRDKVEGSGLGLALVKKIVEQQGGKIWLESTVGVGTTFHFTWPKRNRERQ